MPPSSPALSFIRPAHVRRISRMLVAAFALACLLAVRPAHWFSHAADAEAHVPQLATLSAEPSVRVPEDMAPTVQLTDGRAVLTAYQGPAALQAAFEQNEAQPLALTTADFDEDGVPDLIAGYNTPQGNALTSLRGNVDALYPHAPEAKQRQVTGTFTNAPFLSPAHIFPLTIAPDFLAAGDFDADGHWDIAAAERGGNVLTFMAGDGRGQFAQAKEIALPGTVTALTSGEMNRADGLTDLVVGVRNEKGAAVLVFEGPEGALRAEPEILNAPAAVNALTLGQLDNSYEMDLAIAAGTNLLVVHGRDRKLSLDAEQQRKVLSAHTELRTFATPINSLVIGDFTASHKPALALLDAAGQVQIIAPTETVKSKQAPPSLRAWSERTLDIGSATQATTLVRTKTSAQAGDDLILLNSAHQQVQLLSGAADSDSQTTTLATTGATAALLPMRLNGDALNDLIVLQAGQVAPTVVHTTSAQTFVVNSTADTDDGACTTAPNGCTLREAINAANQNAGADTINFNIPGSAPFTITITGQFGLPFITDAVTIDGTTQPGFSGKPIIELSCNGASVSGLVITGGNSRVRGLVVNRFSGAAGGISGIVLSGSGNNVIEGNYVGTNVSGTAIQTSACFAGVRTVASNNNLIGGTVAAARNIISSNSNRNIGLDELSSSFSTGNQVQGNYIGTDATGTVALRSSNNGGGIISLGGISNIIGGTTPQARNIISGNANVGVQIGSGATGNLIQGNYIGTDVTGTIALGNDSGVSPNNAPNNTIGGTVSSAANLISGNDAEAISIIFSNANGNLVQGNKIGTDPTGTVALGNSQVRARGAVSIGQAASNNVIGGTVAGARNLISGNRGTGMTIYADANNNSVQGNLIGTDVTGATPLPNLLSGIYIQNANTNLIGGNTPEARNIISGNGSAGISLYGGPNATGGGPANNNRIEGNFIGTNAAGTAKLSNSADGIQVTINQGSATNTIGGATTDRRNIISGNNGNGIAIGIRLNDPNTGQPLSGTGGTGITLQNNYIGIDVNGQNCLGNTLNGVFVDADSQINTIADNLIACNGQNGVYIPQNNNPGVRILIDNNNIYKNGALGIDLGQAGITPNDPLDTDGGANLQQNFPVLTGVSSPIAANGKGGVSPQGTVTVSGTLNSTPNTIFLVHWYFSADQQCVNNQEQSRQLDSQKFFVTSDAQGNAPFTFPFTFPPGVTRGVINATASDQPTNTSEFSACLSVVDTPPLPTIQFSAANFQVGEGDGRATATVTRSGDTSGTATVDYRTTDTDTFTVGCADTVNNHGGAYGRCDFATTVGTLQFAASETQKTITIPVIDDAHAEGNETFQVVLSNPSGATLGTPATATLTIQDNDQTGAANPIFGSPFFVRQQYLDFLSREPDTGGFNAWLNVLNNCSDVNNNPACDRILVSQSFFGSPEFQLKGFYVFRFYKLAFNRLPEYLEIIPDMSFVAGATADEVFARKAQLATNFTQRQEFQSTYGSLTNSAYVTALLNRYQLTQVTTPDPQQPDGTTKVTLTSNDLSNRLTANTLTRAQVFRAIADSDQVNGVEFNNAFVAMQYYGYLRRKPEDAGYQAWLRVLQAGDIRTMVNGFMNSNEYRLRFGQP